MPLTREERKLLHQKSKQPTFGTGKPDNREGNEGDISFRKVEGSGTVEYVKQNNEWIAVASSGEMPPVRIVGSSSGGSSVGVTSHSGLSGLSQDDHIQYLLVDGSRAMTGDLSLGGGDGALTFTVAGENSIKIPDNQASALIIEEANTAYLTFVTTDGDEKITLNKKLEAGSVEIEGSAFDIDGGNIDGTAIGASSHTTIKGTTIDATTDFTIGGTVITDATITDDGDFTIDANGDITLDANGADISFKDNNTHPLIFTNSSGSWHIDSNTASSTLSLGARTRPIIKMKEDGTIYMNGYDANYGTIQIRDGVTVASNYEDYKINILGDKHMFTMGEADFKQNYSMLSEEYESAGGTFHASYGT